MSKRPLINRVIPDYLPEKGNRLNIALSEEDYHYLLETFIEHGAPTALATIAIAGLLNKMRKEGIKNYADRLQSDNYANLDRVLADLYGN